MPDSTNAYLAGKLELSDNNPTGVSIGQSATEKVGIYGVTPVVQATTIAAQTAAVTTTDFNLLLTAVKNIGIVASS